MRMEGGATREMDPWIDLPGCTAETECETQLGGADGPPTGAETLWLAAYIHPFLEDSRAGGEAEPKVKADRK